MQCLQHTNSTACVKRLRRRMQFDPLAVLILETDCCATVCGAARYVLCYNSGI
jgi:hypothetical protein